MSAYVSPQRARFERLVAVGFPIITAAHLAIAGYGVIGWAQVVEAF